MPNVQKSTCEEGPVCWICHEREGGELLRGCACRGTSGYVHAECMIEANRHRTEQHHTCPTCKQSFVGPLALEIAAARANGFESIGFNASAVNQLATTLLYQEHYAEALMLYKQVLQDAVRRCGPDNPGVASTCGNIGCVHSNLGNYKKALKYHYRDLAFKMKTFGPDHLPAASTRTNIGIVLYQQGKFSEAKQMYEHATEVRVRRLGVHADTALSMMGIAFVLKAMGNVEEALIKYNEVLRIQEQMLGLDHPHLAFTYNGIGQVYLHHAKYPEAMEIYEKALAINMKHFGPEHLKVARVRDNMAIVYRSMGELDKALELGYGSLRIFEKELGHDHPDTATAQVNIGDVLAAQGENAKAREMYSTALKTRIKKLGPDHPETATARSSIGEQFTHGVAV